jgi:four helix bundle protein
MVTKIESYRDLIVWQKAMDLAERCYLLTERFPARHQPVLGYQIRKSSVSVPSNIAEGHCRHYTPVYVQHLWTSHGSGGELETQLEIGGRVKLVKEEEAAALIANAEEVRRMLRGLVASLERTPGSTVDPFPRRR